MPKKTEVAKREDTFLVDPSQFPDTDPRDQEGYEEMPFQVLTFVKIDHDNDGVFKVKNTLLGDLEPVDELNMIVFGDHPYARVLFEGGNAVCKSMDSVTAFDPMTSTEKAKCAVCKHKDDDCSAMPIFIGDEVGAGNPDEPDFRKGLGLIVLTFGASGIRCIRNLKSELQIRAKDAGFSARYLPLYWFQLNITTEMKERQGFKPWYIPKFRLACQLQQKRILELRKQRDQYIELSDKDKPMDDVVETEVTDEMNGIEGRGKQSDFNYGENVEDNQAG